MRSLAFYLFHACVVAAGLAAIGSPAHAGAPAPAGKRALLSLTIQVDGAGQRVAKSDGTNVKWSTHRLLDAKVELVAAKAEGTSAADIKGQVAAAYKPSADMAALQKEAQKCKPDDTACQMEIAMRMMETDDAKNLMRQSEAAQEAPARYQPWKTPSKGGRVEVKAEYQEQWDGVFLTASREERNCKLALPSATLAAKDRASLEDGVKGVNLEVDTQTGKSSLMLVVVSYALGELKCHIDDGGRVSDESESRTMSFKPPIDFDSTGGWVQGSAVADATISRGELNFDTRPEAHALTGMMSVTAPLKVKIRWQLTPL